MFSEQERAAVSHILEQVGVRTPEDAIRKLGLEPEFRTLVQQGVPVKVATDVLLVAYGKAVKAGGSVILKGLAGLLSAGKSDGGGASFP